MENAQSTEIAAALKTIPEQHILPFWKGPKFWVTPSLSVRDGCWCLGFYRELPNGRFIDCSEPVGGVIRAGALATAINSMQFMWEPYPDFCVRFGVGLDPQFRDYATPEEARAAAEKVLRDAAKQVPEELRATYEAKWRGL